MRRKPNRKGESSSKFRATQEVFIQTTKGNGIQSSGIVLRDFRNRRCCNASNGRRNGGDSKLAKAGGTGFNSVLSANAPLFGSLGLTPRHFPGIQEIPEQTNRLPYSGKWRALM